MKKNTKIKVLMTLVTYFLLCTQSALSQSTPTTIGALLNPSSNTTNPLPSSTGSCSSTTPLGDTITCVGNKVIDSIKGDKEGTLIDQLKKMNEQFTNLFDNTFKGKFSGSEIKEQSTLDKKIDMYVKISTNGTYQQVTLFPS